MSQKPICIVCNKRVARFLDFKVCKPCNTLLRAEKSWKKFGLRRPRAQWMPDAQFVATYNKLAPLGLAIHEIAERMGLQEQTLKNRKAAMVKRGFVFERQQGFDKFKSLPSEPVDRSTKTARANEHGGGKCGISGCHCEPCLERRRRYRREWNAAHPEEVRRNNANGEAKRKARRQASKRKPS